MMPTTKERIIISTTWQIWLINDYTVLRPHRSICLKFQMCRSLINWSSSSGPRGESTKWRRTPPKRPRSTGPVIVNIFFNYVRNSNSKNTGLWRDDEVLEERCLPKGLSSATFNKGRRRRRHKYSRCLEKSFSNPHEVGVLKYKYSISDDVNASLQCGADTTAYLS